LKVIIGVMNVKYYIELLHDPWFHIVQDNMADYYYVYIQIPNLLHRFAPQEANHTYSDDEIWITMNGLKHLYGEPWECARNIQTAILNYFGITSVIVIGDNKFLAKVVIDLMV